MSDIERVDPPGMRFAGMSQAVRRGDWITVSGQVALKDGQVVGIGDAAAQARQCFANIGTVLAEAGASLGDVVSLRCFLTDRSAYEGYAEVKNTCSKTNHQPRQRSLLALY
jgi:2-iminobutanoate/2-iminopropanoate deaminase